MIDTASCARLPQRLCNKRQCHRRLTWKQSSCRYWILGHEYKIGVTEIFANMFGRLLNLFKPNHAEAESQVPLPQAPFEYIATHGAQAAETMEKARETEGAFPVLLGDRSAFVQTLDLMSTDGISFESTLAAGLSLDPELWMKDQVDSDPEHFDFRNTKLGRAYKVLPLTAARNGGFGDGFKKEVFIGLLPVSHGWQVPALLGLGGWNACPEAHVHVAFFRRWQERYGAEVTSVAYDVVEFKVSRPPSTAEEALALAREHYIYCTDFDLGASGIGGLAAHLLNSPSWYFWWD